MGLRMIKITTKPDERMRAFKRAANNLPALQKKAMREVGYWLKGLRPYAGVTPSRSWMAYHFTSAAYVRYGYPIHRMPYRMLRGGTQHPLVMKGRLGSSVFRSAVIPTETSVTLSTRGAPVYANIHRHGGIISLPDIYPVKKKALAWYDASMRVVGPVAMARAHKVEIPKRDFFMFVAQDRVWTSQALTEIWQFLLFGSAK
jgi:phage gpG-like protein